MSLNWIGLVSALATFLGIWLGHVAVRKIEYHSPTLWLPSLAALVLAVLLEYGALSSQALPISTALGIFGITLFWDALEFWRQAHRVEKGHAPANPNNPRHARLLAKGGLITTLDPLEQGSTGQQIAPDERREIRKSVQ